MVSYFTIFMIAKKLNGKDQLVSFSYDYFYFA